MSWRKYVYKWWVVSWFKIPYLHQGQIRDKIWVIQKFNRITNKPCKKSNIFHVEGKMEAIEWAVTLNKRL